MKTHQYGKQSVPKTSTTEAVCNFKPNVDLVDNDITIASVLVADLAWKFDQIKMLRWLYGLFTFNGHDAI